MKTVFIANDRMGPATRHPETGNLSHWPNDWEASFIALANPATILALLAERAELKKDAERPLNIEAAARKLAECMDYPWDYMPKQGRDAMRGHAQAVIAAAMQEPKP